MTDAARSDKAPSGGETTLERRIVARLDDDRTAVNAELDALNARIDALGAQYKELSTAVAATITTPEVGAVLGRVVTTENKIAALDHAVAQNEGRWETHDRFVRSTETRIVGLARDMVQTVSKDELRPISRRNLTLQTKCDALSTEVNELGLSVEAHAKRLNDVEDLVGPLKAARDTRPPQTAEFGTPGAADWQPEKFADAVRRASRPFSNGAPHTDTARLDWLETHEIVGNRSGFAVTTDHPNTWSSHTTIRDAIDDAMKRSGK